MNKHIHDIAPARTAARAMARGSACSLPPAPRLSCDASQSSLCDGVRTVLRADCEELRSVAVLRAVVQRIGLSSRYLPGYPKEVYGHDARYMVNVSTAAAATGMWQDPLQIAAALVRVGSLVAAQPEVDVARYAEIGAFSGWTTSFICAFLQRVLAASCSRPARFEGYAIDVRHQASDETMTLMRELNISFTLASQVPSLLRSLSASGARLARPAPAFNFCFIDGGHSFADVARDYIQFAPHCRALMLHDIADERVLHHGAAKGGGGLRRKPQRCSAPVLSHPGF